MRWTPAHDLWHGVMDTEFNKGRPPPAEKKLFVPKVDLPTLRSYRKPASSAFWERFPRHMVWPGKSPINPDALEALGRSLGLWDDRFEQVVHDIRFGAVLGCRGEARLPTVSKNAASAYQFGRQATGSKRAMLTARCARRSCQNKQKWLASCVRRSQMARFG